MHPKHNPVTDYIWIKRKKGHEDRWLQRPKIDGATDTDRLTQAARSDESTGPGPADTSFGEPRRLHLAATRGRAHRLANPTCVQRPPSASLPSNAKSMALCLCVSLLGVGCVPSQATRVDNVAHIPNPMLKAAWSEDADIPIVMEPRAAVAHGSSQDLFAKESASPRTREMADWVVSSRDNQNLPFAIIDKVNAKVYVFDANGHLYGAAPVLLGLAKGDSSAPGVGNKPLSGIPPAQRTTPAGRFVSQMGVDSRGAEILWLDYHQSLSMHAVVKGMPQDHRAERLASPTPLDNRISFGCINVPTEFFKNGIQSKFSGKGGIVYVLPETRRFG